MQPDQSNQNPPSPHAARQRWMAVLARAGHREIMSLLERLPQLPPHSVLRGPESGLVMVRGRAGGAGAAFNIGEMSVTRCTVRGRTFKSSWSAAMQLCGAARTWQTLKEWNSTLQNRSARRFTDNWNAAPRHC